MSTFQMLLTAYASAHIYLFLCLRRAFGGGLWQLPVLVLLTLLALSWFFRWGRTVGAVGGYIDLIVYAWMGFFIFCISALLLADILALASRLLALVIPADIFKKATAVMVAPKYVPFALIIAGAFFIHGVFEAHTPRVKQVTLTTSKLPPGTPPLRIAAVSDVHIVGFIGTRFLDGLATKVNALKPDIFISCGDLVDSNLNGKNDEAAAMRKIDARYGKYAVIGNHEVYRGLQMSLDFMKRSGLRVLRGGNARAGGITIVGVDDRALTRRSPATTDTLAALKRASQDTFVLLLNHQPVWKKETIGLFDLQYSGHTHGGQIWPGIYLAMKEYGTRQGLTTLRNGAQTSLLYVANGVGYWGPPIRFLAPPEITLFVLTPEE